ncbi:hypothetical protein H4R35_006426 [Dimargaris xerosporica]|nr:hypothetical protein H4R35_006426 [Dimargaris xerosporica]
MPPSRYLFGPREPHHFIHVATEGATTSHNDAPESGSLGSSDRTREPSQSPATRSLSAPCAEKSADCPPHQQGVRQRWKRWLTDFNSPGGVTPEHRRYVRLFGQVGFIAKGIVYGIIGGLTISTATNSPSPGGSQDNASPQGAFLLIGSAGPVAIPLLLVMAVGLAFYIVWRFWEAFTGQGADQTFSSLKNFFKYRLSPFVSGCVYTAYLFYVIFVAIKDHLEDRDSEANSGCFPSCWNQTVIGRVGLGFIGVAFLIATLTQLGPAFTGSFHGELRVQHTHKRWLKLLVYVAGHIGFLARAGVFLLVAVLVLKSIDSEVDQTHFTVGASINQLRHNKAGKACLWLLGLGLVVYGLFAISNSYFKYFPTRPRNNRPFPRRHAHAAQCPLIRASAISPSTNEPCPHCGGNPLPQDNLSLHEVTTSSVQPPATAMHDTYARDYDPTAYPQATPAAEPPRTLYFF